MGKLDLEHFYLCIFCAFCLRKKEVIQDKFFSLSNIVSLTSIDSRLLISIVQLTGQFYWMIFIRNLVIFFISTFFFVPFTNLIQIFLVSRQRLTIPSLSCVIIIIIMNNRFKQQQQQQQYINEFDCRRSLRTVDE